MRKAAVLPLPVRAMATTSLPSSMTGMALRCMGVGALYPFFAMPRKTLLSKPAGGRDGVCGSERREGKEM